MRDESAAKMQQFIKSMELGVPGLEDKNDED